MISSLKFFSLSALKFFLLAWRRVSASFWKGHQDDDWRIKLRATGRGWRTELWATGCCRCEEVEVVKRVHTLLGGVHRLATALKVVEEVQEEVQEIKDEWEDEEVEGNGGLKVEGEPHTSCMDEMTCATPLSHAVQCVNHDDTNLTKKQENCALTCQCSCALCWRCSGSWWSRCHWCRARFHHADVIPRTDFFPSGFCSSFVLVVRPVFCDRQFLSIANYCTLLHLENGSFEVLSLQQKILQVKKIHLHPSTDGETYVKKIDDPANNLKPQSEEEHEFHMKASQGRKIRYSPCNDRCKHWSIGRMHTTCKYCRTGKHFVDQNLRCWLIQQQNRSGWKFACSQILHRVLESRIQIHPIIGQQIRSVWNEHGSVEHFTLTAREVQFMWHVLTGASIDDTKKHIQKYLHGQTPECFDETIIFHVYVQRHRMDKKRQYRNLSKEVAAFATQFKPGQMVLPGARVREDVVERKIQQNQGQWSSIALQMVVIFKCHAFHRYSQRQSHCRLDSWGNEE